MPPAPLKLTLHMLLAGTMRHERAQISTITSDFSDTYINTVELTPWKQNLNMPLT